MAVFAAGQRLTAALLNGIFSPSASDTQNTLGTTLSTTYTATLTGGTACGLTFVAPASGCVMVHNSTVLDSSASAVNRRTYCTFQIKTGGTIGSGTTFTAASDDNAIYNSGDYDIEVGRAIRITGLTPLATYNCQQLFRNGSADTATYISKQLAVVPVV